METVLIYLDSAILLYLFFDSRWTLNLNVVKNIKSVKKKNSLIEQEEIADQQDYTDMLSVSEHVALRESAYNQRIERMKEEMALRNSIKAKPTSPAQELHPDVKNLPHNIIESKVNTLPDVEIVE